VEVTEEVLQAAAGNFGSGELVIRLLLDRRGDKVKLTEEVLKAAAGNAMRGWWKSLRNRANLHQGTKRAERR
jgi:hypothetical protein